ncbi:Chloroperoxidase [Boletus reticuloceps]|uniref:Chloroperoxidase n=1 Tax=Boletus reticuloceps TaxID=495285 RepID=A0A8I2Z060_9AGAM|nr:Chloroperoxidase [Boletus reticuloceps]
MKFLASISNAFYVTGILTWDVLLTLANLVRTSRPVGKVIPHGHPGYGGYWPEYKPPQEGDSRCCCPALNAMANHGIFPRNGRGIKFTEAPKYLRSTYNFSPSFCYFACHHVARMLNRNYSEDTFDLEELNIHNGIEHDASLTRLDSSLQPNQAVPDPAVIEQLFSFATGKDANGKPLLMGKDLSRILGKRRVESKASNKEYSLQFAHKIFGSANASTMSVVFGGRVDDLRVILLEDRFPEGWESRVRKPYGLTILTLNCAIFAMEFRVREADWVVDGKQVESANQTVEEDG